jgi:hypothetical protein
MTGCNLGMIIVDPTFAARRLHLSKTPGILASKFRTICREHYLVILLKRSLSRHLGITFLNSKHVLVQISFFVSECWTYSLSLPSMGLDHDSSQVMKFVYMWLTCCVPVLKRGAKIGIAPTEATGVYSFVQYIVCVAYGPETFGVTSDEIRLMYSI